MCRWKVFLFCFLLSAAGEWSRADLNPKRLTAFDLGGFKALRGFMATADTRKYQDPAINRPAAVAASLYRRYLLGADELTFTILLFSTRDQMNEWVVNSNKDNSGPKMQLRNWTAGKDKLQELWVLPGTMEKLILKSSATAVNRVLIYLTPSKRMDMFRRDPQEANKSLPDAEFAKRIQEIKNELIIRAKALPENRK